MRIAMIVHGGAWAIPDDQVEAHLAGCRAALAAGWAILESGGSARDACEVAVRLLEDDPTFDAGTGSHLTAAGSVELDAAMMDGQSLRYGAVASLQRVRNPIALAHRLLHGPATFLVGEGAERYAAAQGMALCENSELVIERERALWEQWRASQAATAASGPQHILGGRDTVGAIALDQGGNLVAANSTGGTPLKLPGRVGDTPLIGCGLYADAQIGAAVCTGWGEAIVRVALARRVVDMLERGLAPQSAAEAAVRILNRRVAGGTGGCIVLTPDGRPGLAWNTRRMAYAYRSGTGEPVVGV
ncbi:MAG: isoaspartyl peptidase/L-asparaginase [Chloroflexaceae bacterium]